ncbi:carbohydrate ABC transporter permease [Leifsonia shinshuensis]
MVNLTVAPPRASRSEQPAPVVAPPRRRARRPRRLAPVVMLAPAVLGLVVFFAYPLIADVVLSFTNFNQLGAPSFIGLRNYVFMFTQDPRLITATMNTLWFVVILVPCRMIGALLTALLVSKARRAVGLFRTILYMPALLPPVAAVIAFVFLFNPGTGPVNALLRSVGIQGPLWFNDPSWSKPSLVLMGLWMAGDMMIIFLAALLDSPVDQHEAASLDGANAVQRFWYITMPSLSPVILFAAVTGGIAALQYFTEAAIASSVASGRSGVSITLSQVLGYPNDSLLTFSQWLYTRGFGEFQLGYASALAVAMLVVTSLLLLLVARQIRSFINPTKESR